MLGQFSVMLNEQLLEIHTRPAQSLFAYLVLNAGVPQRRERLAGMIWPDTEEASARRNLRVLLSGLRKDLQGESSRADKIIAADSYTVNFYNGSDCWVDVSEFENQAHSAQTPEELQSVLSLYGGELLPGFYDNWVILERERYRALFEDKMYQFLECLLQMGRHRDAIEWAERWIAFGQVPEPAYRALMLAHYANGDASKAALTYRRCTQTLRQELGVQPSPQTREAYKILVEGRSAEITPSMSFLGETGTRSAEAVRTLFETSQKKGDTYLEISILAMVYACRADLFFEPEEAAILLRSAVFHGFDAAPWIEQMESDDRVITALKEVLAEYPRPEVRQRIVEAAAPLESEIAGEFLFQMVKIEDSPKVCSAAAVAAARNGRLLPVVDYLIDELQNNNPAASTALVAVADQVGLPAEVKDYPRLPVWIALARRRWGRNHRMVFWQTRWAAFGAGLADVIYGASTPLFYMFASPERFQSAVDQYSLSGWVLMSMISALFVGSFQGALAGFAVGAADALWGERAKYSRWVLGSASGLFYGLLLVSYSLTSLITVKLMVSTGAALIIAGIFGCWFGFSLTLLVPRLGKSVSLSQQAKRLLVSYSMIIFGMTICLKLIFNTISVVVIINWILELIAIATGLALAMARKKHVPVLE